MTPPSESFGGVRSAQAGVEPAGGDGSHRPADPEPAVLVRTNLDRARPAGELALVQEHGFAGADDAVPQQISDSGASRAAGGDVLDSACVVPGAALWPVRVEHIDELRSGARQQIFEGW